MMKLTACLPHLPKKLMFLFVGLVFVILANSQTYPEPEFKSEVYALQKEGTPTLVRLEKNAAKQETKTKLGGFGGVEYGYAIEGKKSPVRLPSGNHSFVFSRGSSSTAKSNSDVGMDMSAAMGMDPTNMISLYKTTSDKTNRKINLMQNSGAFGNKNKSSDKYTISIKQIRDGYWELLVDKPLGPGEYSFVVMTYSADGYHMLFAFGVD